MLAGMAPLLRTILESPEMLIRAKRFKAAQRSIWLAVLMDDFPLHASVWLDKSQVEVSRGSSVKGFNWRAGIQSSQGLWPDCYCQLPDRKGDTFEIMLPLRCGEYQLKALIGRAPRGGILQLSIDGEHVGTFDFFAEQKERDMSWESMQLKVSSTRVHSLRATVRSKANRSQGYRWYIRCIVIRSANLQDDIFRFGSREPAPQLIML